jgi:hypothetical protein
MNALKIVKSLFDCGADLRVVDGRVVFRRDVVPAELLAEAAKMRDEIRSLIIRGPEDAAWILELAKAASGRSRRMILQTFAGLARRWLAAGDPRLYEVREAVSNLLQRWKEEDWEAARKET